MEVIAELFLGGWNLIKMGFSDLGKFLGSLNAQGVVGLIVSLGLALATFHEWGEARHWKKQSDRYQALYQKDESDFAKIAAKATTLKQQIEQLSSSISQTLKDQHDAKANSIDADARALLMRGPGKAACTGHTIPATVSSGRDPSASSATSAGPQVSPGNWIAVPFDWLGTVLTEHDQLLNDDQTYRTNDQRQRQSWPSSSTPAVNP